MTGGRVVFLVASLAASAVCIRLGLWQWGRMEQKNAANARIERQIETAPVEIAGPLPAGAPEGRVALRGRFDADRHVLLRGRMDSGEPGVELVTPFLIAGDSSAVLVDRGWLPAEDGATLPLETLPEDTATRVVGLLRAFEAGRRIPPMRLMTEDDRRAWSAPRLVRDSLALRMALPLASMTLLELPVADAAPLPRRHVPHIEGASMHLGYTIQWFAIALLIPVIAWFLSRPKRPKLGIVTR